MIYFCHIPRTSGPSVAHAVHRSLFDQELHILKKPDIDKYDPYFNKEINKEKFESFLKFCHLNVDFLYGHFLASPYIVPYDENLETFSIVRNPLERLISEFYYINRGISLSDWTNYKIHEIKEFLYSPNNLSQCFWLLGNYDWDKMELIKNSVQVFWPGVEEKNVSFEEILKIIKKRNIKLSTIENRVYLLTELEYSLNKIKKTNITLDKQLKANEHLHAEERQEFNDPKLFLSKEEIKMFEDKNKLDYKLYNYVKNHEIKTQRCLVPEDIKI